MAKFNLNATVNVIRRVILENPSADKEVVASILAHDHKLTPSASTLTTIYSDTKAVFEVYRLVLANTSLDDTCTVTPTPAPEETNVVDLADAKTTKAARQKAYRARVKASHEAAQS